MSLLNLSKSFDIRLARNLHDETRFIDETWNVNE